MTAESDTGILRRFPPKSNLVVSVTSSTPFIFRYTNRRLHPSYTSSRRSTELLDESHLLFFRKVQVFEMFAHVNEQRGETFTGGQKLSQIQGTLYTLGEILLLIYKARHP